MPDSSILDLVESLSNFLYEKERYNVWEIADDHIILTDNYGATNLEIKVEVSG
jgi:hypothetical protein